MTVSYQYEVASSTSGGFTRLLFMWKGSLYKLIYRELLLFVAAFGLLSALYRNTFNSDQRRIFEKMVMYCDTFINLIPLSFVLGFYVAYVAGRWWQQYMAIPWPDKIMHSIALYVSGSDDHARMVRRTLMRYLNLSLILVLRSISSAVKRRFPTLEHVVEAGFMTATELEMYQSVPSVEFNTYWIPCTWFISLLKETKKANQIEDSQGLHIIMEEFNEFRSKCGLLWSYDWVSIPLVYTQVVTIATYSFFLAALVGRQYVDASKKPLQMEIDIYLPVFTILQFFFFMGLLKVAEQLINPFGDDDEDFELNWLIDRHTKVSYLGVDILMRSAPPLVKDMYFDQVDLTLPYTEASVAYKKKTYRGSVHNMTVPEDKHTMFLPEISEEDEEKSQTPRSSVSHFPSMTQSSGPKSAPVMSAAAAGTWRFPSSPSFHTSFKVDSEEQANALSSQMYKASFPQDQKADRVDTKSVKSSGRDKFERFLSRSESISTERPIFFSRSVMDWPSASTLGQSDASFHYSEQSMKLQGSYCSSNFLINVERTPEKESISNYPASVAYRKKRDDAALGMLPGGKSGYDCEGCIHGDSGGHGHGNSCGGSDNINCNGIVDSLGIAGTQSGGISNRNKVDRAEGGKRTTNDIRRNSVTSDASQNDNSIEANGDANCSFEFLPTENSQLSLGTDIRHNRSPCLSQISMTIPVMQKHYDHYDGKPKEETEYVKFRKGFKSACIAKVRSCPKLVLVKRQHSTNSGKKKGVRWKPMLNNTSDKANYFRRQTVEILPVTPAPSSSSIFFPNKTNLEEVESMNQPMDSKCPWCRKQFQKLLHGQTSSVDSEQFVIAREGCESSSSFTQELCPLHYRMHTNEGIQGSPTLPSRFVINVESSQPKCLPFQERRATVSTLSLTGSELEAKRWRNRFWEHGFLKKLKYFYTRKKIPLVPVVVKRTNIFTNNKRLISQSLPNITFSHIQLESSKGQLNSKPASQVISKSEMGDMTSTESEDSSCFASIMEMQEDEEDIEALKESKSNGSKENKQLPSVSLNIPEVSSEVASMSPASMLQSGLLIPPSRESSWQSAEWAGIIETDYKHNSPNREKVKPNNSLSEDHTVSSPEEKTEGGSDILQEVVIESANDSRLEEQSSKSVS